MFEQSQMSASNANDRQKQAPLFSIITATFNAGALFERTRASIEAQSCHSFEWIVIDGASRDSTVERIKAAGNLVTAWVSERDEGIADAWNKGITRARGKYVLLLNAGDTYDPDFLLKVARYCDGERIVCCHARLSTLDGEVIGIFRAQPSRLRVAMHLPHNWCAVPAHCYSSIGPYRKVPLAMDFEWFHRYYKRYGSQGFIVLDEALGTYYLGGASDRGYADSFRINQIILIENGMNPLLARLCMLAYRVKHALKHRSGAWRAVNVK
jgi:glycosyltransferase involved in cell wall biosynthesis